MLDESRSNTEWLIHVMPRLKDRGRHRVMIVLIDSDGRPHETAGVSYVWRKARNGTCLVKIKPVKFHFPQEFTIATATIYCMKTGLVVCHIKHPYKIRLQAGDDYELFTG